MMNQPHIKLEDLTEQHLVDVWDIYCSVAGIDKKYDPDMLNLTRVKETISDGRRVEPRLGSKITYQSKLYIGGQYRGDGLYLRFSFFANADTLTEESNTMTQEFNRRITEYFGLK